MARKCPCGASAEVPDRNVTGRPVKRICRKCHARRLSGDLRRVLASRKEDHGPSGQ